MLSKIKIDMILDNMLDNIKMNGVPILNSNKNLRILPSHINISNKNQIKDMV
jgi:hypothetical protein